MKCDGTPTILYPGGSVRKNYRIFHFLILLCGSSRFNRLANLVPSPK